MMICKGYIKQAPHYNTKDKTTTFRSLIKNHEYKIQEINEEKVKLTDEGEEEGITITISRKKFDENFQLPYCVTTHSTIGLTIKSPITLFDWQESDKKWFWSAITRTTSLSHISFYTGPQFVNKKELIKHIEEKIAQHKKYDQGRGFYEAESFVDVPWTLDAIQKTHWICPRNGCEMTMEGDRQWSINRLDNDEGHGKQNCEIICLSCNKAMK